MISKHHESLIPSQVLLTLKDQNIKTLRPAQKKALDNGLLQNKNLLICTPTASGKTLIAEIAAIDAINKGGKAVYIVPLKALANEKYNDFKNRYPEIKIALSIGDLDKKEDYLANMDFIICTAEKLDSLIRHHAPWLRDVACLVVDEIHLLNDPSRGPTLEILITLLKTQIQNIHILALSATIGNPKELADWLEAECIQDNFRPVELHQGICYNEEITMYTGKSHKPFITK